MRKPPRILIKILSAWLDLVAIEPISPSNRIGERIMISFELNGETASSDAAPETPLLIVLREELGFTGTKYGCGAGMCGACTVHVDGFATFSCLTPIGDVEGAAVKTIEGLGEGETHPLQRAWIAEQVPQCGYCQSGQIMKAAELLEFNPEPSLEDIKAHMSANLCRCGTYKRIARAIQRASRDV